MVVKLFLICSKCTISRWKVDGKLAVCSKFPQTVWNTWSRPSWLYILISCFMDNFFHFYKVDAKSNCFHKVSHVVDIFNTGDIEPREFCVTVQYFFNPLIYKDISIVTVVLYLPIFWMSIFLSSANCLKALIQKLMTSHHLLP